MQAKFEALFQSLSDKGEEFRLKRPPSTPGDTQTKQQVKDLTMADLTTLEKELLNRYSSVVGSIGFPAKMCSPELSQAYSMLSRNLANPQPPDYSRLKEVLLNSNYYIQLSW